VAGLHDAAAPDGTTFVVRTPWPGTRVQRRAWAIVMTVVVATGLPWMLSPARGRRSPEVTPGHAGAGVLHMDGPGAISSAHAQRPATVVRPVSCEPLPHVPGMSVTTAIVDFPPGAYSPRHRHPGSVTAYVLKGTLRSQLAGGPVGTYTVGRSWFEPPGAIHLFVENASAAKPAELLAVFVAESDCGPLVIPDDGDD